MKDSHTPGKMPYVCHVCNYRLSAVANVEAYFRTWLGNMNNLPVCFAQTFQTGDILHKSCLKALEQEGLSMFHVLATVSEPEGKYRQPNQESSVIQKARAIVRVAF